MCRYAYAMELFAYSCIRTSLTVVIYMPKFAYADIKLSVLLGGYWKMSLLIYTIPILP